MSSRGLVGSAAARRAACPSGRPRAARTSAQLAVLAASVQCCTHLARPDSAALRGGMIALLFGSSGVLDQGAHIA